MREKIENALKETKVSGIEKLLAHLVDCGYYEAPCSTAYHLCQDGGLALHSWNVFQFGVQNFQHLLTTKEDWNSWAIVSLLHDLGKSKYRNKDNYVPNILKSGKVSDSKPYETNKERLYIPHEIVSLQILGRYIDLTEDEEFAILYHNGMYVSSGRDINGKERKLQQLLHFADMYCSRFIEV